METIFVIAVYAQKFSFILFVAALICGWAGISQIKKGEVSRGRTLLKVAFVACVVLAGSYGIIFLFVRSGMTLFMAALWGFFAYQNWRRIQMTGGW